MIAGWSTLQLSLGSDSHSKGASTLAPPAIVSRSNKEQNLSLCRSYGDRGGHEPHSEGVCFPELKGTLVESLVGALINATEILDGYAHPSGVSTAFKCLLGVEARSQDHDLVLATDSGHALPHCEPLQLLSHERVSHGSPPHTPFSSGDGNVISSLHGSLQPANKVQAHQSVRSSSEFRSGGALRGHRDLSVNTVHAGDHGHSHHHDLPASSEEDLLLQEARFKAFRSRAEPNEWKSSSQAGVTSDGLAKTVDAVPPHSTQARDVGDRESLIALKAHAAAGKPWSFAEVTTFSQQNSLFGGVIALSMLLTGALFVTCRSILPLGRQLRKPSVKRRILKSQWYGSPGSQSWEHKNFEMRISEFPKYPMLEVDGDKKLLRFPSNSNSSSATFLKRGGHLPGATKADQGQPIRQTIYGTTHEQVSNPKKAQGKPIRQAIYGSKALPGRQQGLNKVQSHRDSNGKALSGVEWPQLSKDKNETYEEDRSSEFSQYSDVPVIDKASRGVTAHGRFPLGGLHGKRVPDSVQEINFKHRSSRFDASKSRIGQGHWDKDDQSDLDRRIQKLYETIQAVEQHRRAAMLALDEERQRSLALEEEMVKQRETSAMLGEEVRLLKESHSALLTSLQKKYSTSAAARTAADLVYQDWERHAAAE